MICSRKLVLSDTENDRVPFVVVAGAWFDVGYPTFY